MSGNHSMTTHYREKILNSCGYVRIGNTSLFRRFDTLLFSPGVSINQNGKLWFDIREVNIKKSENFRRSFLLVRVVGFESCFFTDMSNMKNIMDRFNSERNGNKVWRFIIDPSLHKIYNRISHTSICAESVKWSNVCEKIKSVIIY